MTHQLKTWPSFFDAIKNGRKTFEIRIDDRGFECGHTLNLREFNPLIGRFTGRSIKRKITYITDFEQKPKYVVMSIKPIK